MASSESAALYAAMQAHAYSSRIRWPSSVGLPRNRARLRRTIRHEPHHAWRTDPGRRARLVYIDINAAPPERLTYIVHVGNAFAEEIVAGRPWASVPELQRIRGIGVSRVAG